MGTESDQRCSSMHDRDHIEVTRTAGCSWATLLVPQRKCQGKHEQAGLEDRTRDTVLFYQEKDEKGI